jgi:hypothetical protein
LNDSPTFIAALADLVVCTLGASQEADRLVTV